MYGRETVFQEFSTLLDSPFDAKLIGIFGSLSLVHQADKFLRNVNVEGSRKHVNLLFRRDGFEARNNGNVDASLSAELDKREELLVVEEHLSDDIVRSSLHFPPKILDVALQIGCLEVLLRIACNTDAEVGCKPLLYCRVEILATIQVANHPNQFRTMRETVWFWQKVLLSRQSVTSQSHDVVDAKEVEIKQFALNSTA